MSWSMDAIFCRWKHIPNSLVMSSLFISWIKRGPGFWPRCSKILLRDSILQSKNSVLFHFCSRFEFFQANQIRRSLWTTSCRAYGAGWKPSSRQCWHPLGSSMDSMEPGCQLYGWRCHAVCLVCLATPWYVEGSFVLFCVDADWWVPYIFFENFPHLIWRLSTWLIVVIASDWGVWTCRICFASATESAQNHRPRTRRRAVYDAAPRPLDLLCPCRGAESRDSDAPILAASWGHALQIPGHDTVKSHSDSTAGCGFDPQETGTEVRNLTSLGIVFNFEELQVELVLRRKGW